MALINGGITRHQQTRTKGYRLYVNSSEWLDLGNFVSLRKTYFQRNSFHGRKLNFQAISYNLVVFNGGGDIQEHALVL